MNLILKNRDFDIPCIIRHSSKNTNCSRTTKGMLDTGCGLTSLTIGALYKLLDIEAISLAFMLKVFCRANGTIKSRIANGDECSCTQVKLHNIYIGDVFLEEMHILVDCTKLLDNNSSESLESIVENTTSVALIGMDIINSFETVYMNSGYTQCVNFDMKEYNRIWNRYGLVSGDITNYNLTIQHAMANLLEEAGVSNYDDNMIDSIYNSLPNHFKDSTEFDIDELRNCVNLYLKAIY